MKKSLVIALCLSLFVLTACTGRFPTRCDQWGWYRPCDLVEGRYAPNSGWADNPCTPCDPCGYREGQVVKREWAFPQPHCDPCPAPAMRTHYVPPSATPMAAPEVVTETPGVTVVE